MTNIILIGFMGTGKTTVGSALAQRLHLVHRDLDELIVKAEGRDIPTIFRESGEDYFRDVESRLLAETLQTPGQVITTGGGAVLRRQNVELMKAGGMVVALKASEEEIIRRVSADPNRPLLAGDAAGRVRELMAKRAGLYDFAPVQVDTSGRQVADIVEEIAAQAVKTGVLRKD